MILPLMLIVLEIQGLDIAYNVRMVMSICMKDNVFEEIFINAKYIKIS
jgi:hypothetical protein